MGEARRVATPDDAQEIERRMFGDEINGGLVRDLCFTVWTRCLNPTHEDGKTDWSSDTLPTVQEGVRRLRAMYVDALSRLRVQRDRWHDVAMTAGAITTTTGGHVYAVDEWKARALKAEADFTALGVWAQAVSEDVSPNSDGALRLGGKVVVKASLVLRLREALAGLSPA